MPTSIPFPPGISNTPDRRVAATVLLVWALCAWAPRSATAAVQPLSDQDLAWITAQGPAAKDAPLATLFAAASVATAAPAGMSAIDAKQFAVDLRALGIEQLPRSFYDGQPVFKIVLDAAPFDLQADLSQLLFPASQSASSLSLGQLRINQIDVSGTRLWIWTH